ncbi:unnamed protein product, partial [Hapterophycus canaliculatus]
DHGLLSSQLHPDFPQEPYLFLFYSSCQSPTPHGRNNDRSGECERIINGLSFCEQNAVLERLELDIVVDDDGVCSDWSYSDSASNRVRLMENWCSSANAHHNAAMEFYTDGSLLVANGDSAQASFDIGEFFLNLLEACPYSYSSTSRHKAGIDYYTRLFFSGHLIRIHADAIMYDSDDLPLTDVNYDIWGMGLRNPFRAAVEQQTGDIYIADVG